MNHDPIALFNPGLARRPASSLQYTPPGASPTGHTICANNPDERGGRSSRAPRRLETKNRKRPASTTPIFSWPLAVSFTILRPAHPGLQTLCHESSNRHDDTWLKDFLQPHQPARTAGIRPSRPLTTLFLIIPPAAIKSIDLPCQTIPAQFSSRQDQPDVCAPALGQRGRPGLSASNITNDCLTTVANLLPSSLSTNHVPLGCTRHLIGQGECLSRASAAL